MLLLKKPSIIFEHDMTSFGKKLQGTCSLFENATNGNFLTVLQHVITS